MLNLLCRIFRETTVQVLEQVANIRDKWLSIRPLCVEGCRVHPLPLPPFLLPSRSTIWLRIPPWRVPCSRGADPRQQGGEWPRASWVSHTQVFLPVKKYACVCYTLYHVCVEGGRAGREGSSVCKAIGLTCFGFTTALHLIWFIICRLCVCIFNKRVKDSTKNRCQSSHDR